MVVNIHYTDFKVVIFFGGPSPERDISLDSARTFYDSIRFIIDPANIILLLIELDETFSIIDDRWIYSNTIEDIILSRKKWGVDNSELRMDCNQLAKHISKTNAFFSFVHGTFGEDGRLENLLRQSGCTQPMLGSSPPVQNMLYDKFSTYRALKSVGYDTVEHLLLNPETDPNFINNAKTFCKPYSKVVMKPRRGGSSDGVSLSSTLSMEDAINKALKFDNEILIERFIDGYEFSIIVIQDISGIPIPLFPTEIVINDRTNPIYTRLKKYMPGSGASHRTPASFSDKQIDLIRDQAYDIFLKLNISDWARFDGFLTSDGNIIWSDLNGIPGFGMDSLLFQQSSLFGLDHENFSIFLLLKVAAKSNLQITGISEKRFDAQKVYVLGGGSTSEKQVSRMSWMNVIQKLKCSHHFDIHPVFVDINNDYFEVPSFLTLQHTIEEIECIIKSDFSFVDAANKASVIASMASKTFNQIRKKGSQYPPKKMTLDEISREADFVFIALHGGFGENGQLQLALDNLKTPYNGSGPYVSELCMDKNKTSMFLDDLKIPNFRGSKNFVVDFRKQFSKYISNITQIRTAITSGMSFDVICDTFDLSRFLSAVRERGEQWQQSLTSPKGLVLKPLSDGCSSGVFLWRVGDDGLAIYILCALANINSIAWSYFKGNYESIPDEIMLRLPFESSDLLLIEELHEADDKLNLIELTIAVHGHSGQMQALVPSETRKDFDLLTLEEKFCKGVGVNITPSDKLSSEQIFSIQKRVIAFANSLKIDGYARIDLMYFIDSDDLVLIEVNTLPGLSSATVTFTQALVTENFQMPPSEFLESLIQIKMFR